MHVQRLRNRELKEAQQANKKKVWKKKFANDKNKSADINMFLHLPREFMAHGDQEAEIYSDFDETEFGELAAEFLLTQQAVFDKPVQHLHLKALYKGYVDGKPVTKMLVDGGAAVNIIPYTTFRKLGKGPEDLLKTDMMLKDFGGNVSKTRGGNTLRTYHRNQDHADNFLCD